MITLRTPISDEERKQSRDLQYTVRTIWMQYCERIRERERRPAPITARLNGALHFLLKNDWAFSTNTRMEFAERWCQACDLITLFTTGELTPEPSPEQAWVRYQTEVVYGEKRT